MIVSKKREQSRFVLCIFWRSFLFARKRLFWTVIHHTACRPVSGYDCQHMDRFRSICLRSVPFRVSPRIDIERIDVSFNTIISKVELLLQVLTFNRGIRSPCCSFIFRFSSSSWERSATYLKHPWAAHHMMNRASETSLTDIVGFILSTESLWKQQVRTATSVLHFGDFNSRQIHFMWVRKRRASKYICLDEW